jgi:3-oxoacyl-(acyl-carrier-protein) synthase
MRRVAITGIGAVTPAGIGLDALWDRAVSGQACTRQINRFDASRYQCQVAGQADAFDASQWLPPRFLKRTDRFTHLAVAAVDEALKDARLTIDRSMGINPERVGVMVGNVLGGWEFAERELRKMWVEGPRQMSPYQATAWFPAAPQGNICIRFGLKGRSRTFVCDRASGAYALIHAAEIIQRGHADVVVAGGTEQPLSPYAWLCCHTSGYLARPGGAPPETAYRPFDRGHTGTVLGEGSVFLILEDGEHARARGAPTYGEIRSWAVSTDAYRPYGTVEPSGTVLSGAMQKTLAGAGLSPGSLGCIFAHGSAVPAEDATEVRAIHAALGGAARRVPVTAPKATIGHLLGASTAADVAIALRGMERRLVPPIANLHEPAPGFDLDFVSDSPRELKTWDDTLVVSRGLGGANTCVLVSQSSQG